MIDQRKIKRMETELRKANKTLDNYLLQIREIRMEIKSLNDRWNNNGRGVEIEERFASFKNG